MIHFIRNVFNYIRYNKIRKHNYILPKNKITYSNDLLFTYHNADFLKETLFLEAYQLGKATDSGILLKNHDIEWRIHVLCWAASHAMKLEGDFVECGVHTGIFARAITHYVDFSKSDKCYYLLDTFSGLDARYSTEKEMQYNKMIGYDKEDSGKLYQQVKDTFRSYNTQIIKGAIPDSLDLVTCNKVSFLSIDLNAAMPEVAALDFFWDKIVSGGIIILDDYGYANRHNEQKEAHDAFAKSKNVMILTLPTCQGMIIKP